MTLRHLLGCASRRIPPNLSPLPCDCVPVEETDWPAKLSAAEAESARLAALLTQTERDLEDVGAFSRGTLMALAAANRSLAEAERDRDEAREWGRKADAELDMARERRDHYMRQMCGAQEHLRESERVNEANIEAFRRDQAALVFSMAEEMACEEVIRLRALLTEARKALEPFARFADSEAEDPIPDGWLLVAAEPATWQIEVTPGDLIVADCRRARALLARLTPTTPRALDMQAPRIAPQEGGHYRARDGNVYGPMVRLPIGRYQSEDLRQVALASHSWDAEGRWTPQHGHATTVHDLVAEIPQAPTPESEK